MLDQRFARDGPTLTELEPVLEATRIGVMKHLRVPEDAGLVVTQRRGRRSCTSSTPTIRRIGPDGTELSGYRAESGPGS
jgi:hypothetical protein